MTNRLIQGHPSIIAWAKATANGETCAHGVKRRSCARCLARALEVVQLHAKEEAIEALRALHANAEDTITDDAPVAVTAARRAWCAWRASQTAPNCTGCGISVERNPLLTPLLCSACFAARLDIPGEPG